MLTDPEINAVTVVTPDHWHALASVRAMEAGKDVFVEKPLSYSVSEGRMMADASLKYQRVTQMGNHIHNDHANYRRVVEMVQSGKLGKITRVQSVENGRRRGRWRRTGWRRTSTETDDGARRRSTTTSGSGPLRTGRITRCGRTDRSAAFGTIPAARSSTSGRTSSTSRRGRSTSRRRPR